MAFLDPEFPPRDPTPLEGILSLVVLLLLALLLFILECEAWTNR